MALGFGFNKAKVLASAEKFVQQGKLQNAISEYEKIIKDDPKDLTVLNTIGDLYMRVGQTEHATHYFKKVGEQYAQDGFTVKAIAIYKKLSRLTPANTENLNRLAELYTTQGLFNDARTQYMQIADQALRGGDNAQAARILQRVLELEPESTSTQAKLADLYLKLGKKEEALHIFYGAAEALYHRGSLEAAEEALKKVIQIDASNSGALLLRGLIAADLKDSDAAVKYLSQVSDLDKHPEALRALVTAKLQSGNDEGVVAIAERLLSQYSDSSGLSSAATWYAIHNRPQDAIRLYERYSDKLLTGDAVAMQQTLSPLIERIKDNPPALEQVTRLLKKGGVDTSQSPEIMEAEAHACAQKGEYARARDLYKRLAELEPENALHAQSYRQMLAKLGEDSATRILSPEEAAQAFMVEELDQSAPAVPQSYDPATEKAIEAALTDAELFVSYNVPAKAVPPLESALALAPRDVTVNQRLATLYIRAERYADAARVCQVLSDVFRESGHEKEASGYLEAARKYGLRAGITLPAPQVQGSRVEAVSEIAPAAPEMPVHPILEEIKPDAPAAEEAAASSVQDFSFDVPDHLAMESAPAMQVISPPIEVPAIEAATPEIMPAHPAAAQREHEPDHANEWENMLSVEDEVAEAATAGPDNLAELPAAEVAADSSASAIADKIQEVHFYISQTMWEEAKRAILDLTEIAPNAPEITVLISAVSAGQSITAAAAASAAPVAAPAAPDFDVTAPTPALVEPAVMPVTAPPLMEVPVMQASAPAVEPPPPMIAQPAMAASEESVLEVSSEPAIVQEAATEEDILDVRPKKQRKAAAKAKPKSSEPAAVGPVGSTEDILTDFVHDLETSDLKDFVPRPVAAETQPVAAPAAAPIAHSNGDMQDSESAMVLSDILTELQEEDATEEEVQEDPETHYNLGIAFKEMGLLDEAIGELQKVCHAMDRGRSFSQPIQVFTWLAQCLVDKGAPEAAVRWYQKALELPGLNSDSRCAIHYDLATAFEASGDKKSALANFMEVYGSNIDFRDVASRIKVLKS